MAALCDAAQSLVLEQALDCSSEETFNVSLGEYAEKNNIDVVLTTMESCLSACAIEECNDTGEASLEDVLYAVFIQIFVFMLVFGLAGSVDFNAFKQRFKSKGIYIGLACQFVLMPLIGFISVLMFRNTNALEPLYAVILLIICASPGGSYSNWWCNLINADLALSVAMTTVSTIVSIGVLPVNIFIYIEFAYKSIDPDGAQEVITLLPYSTIAITLGVVVTAVVSGLAFGYNFPKYMKKANAMGTAAGFISIIMGAVASSTSCAKPWEQPILMYIAIAVPVIAGLFLAMGFASLAGLPKPQRVAVSIETAYQNTGVALAVALSLGPSGRAAAVVPTVYGGYEAVFFGWFSLFSWYIGWTLSPKDESLCVILMNDYQDQIANHPEYTSEYQSKPVNQEIASGADAEGQDDRSKSVSSLEDQDDEAAVIKQDSTERPTESL